MSSGSRRKVAPAFPARAAAVRERSRIADAKRFGIAFS